jgi:fructose-1,6-bisphosphatase/inositol monophosphatase family enzyme
MSKIDLSKIDSIIRDVGAVEVMPRFRKLAEGDIEMKGVNDPVTVADKETERRLTEELTSYLPGSVVVGEETFAKDKSIMARLDSGNPVWIIDPIDGTRNFVSGHPEFAIMVALVKNRQPVASWIHDPNSGDTVMAEKGAGVWLRGKKLRLASGDDLSGTVGLVGARVKKFISDPSLMPSGSALPPIEIGSCAGFDYPRLFAGDVAFANSTQPRAAFLFYRHTNAWDHVPGLFLNQEAGGYSADWSGQPYDMSKPRSGLISAPNKDVWTKLYSLFEPLILHTQRIDR